MIYQRNSFAEGKGLTAAVVLGFMACLISQPVALAAPSVLFGSNLGGGQWDTVRAIATDTAQNIYVVGETYSPDFPGAAWSSSRQTGDAFVVKLSQTGTRIYTVILGGSGYDSARGVAVDSAGNVYVTGLTSSVDFPTTAGAFQRNSGSPGQYDAFVAKISPAGSVVYATFLGGASSDAGYGIALDATGAVYIAGSTNSVNFPVTANAPQARFGGGTDCFVAKLDPTGSTLSYATYLGGENMDACTSIAVDGTGAAFVTGTTSSTGFPTVVALNGVLSGPSDAFVTKLSPAGDHFLFSTYLGGEGADNGNVVRVDSAGNVYVGGDTMSAGFPVTSGAFQTQITGSYDGFLCSIAGDGSAIRFATYLGGTGADSIRDLSLATDGGIIVAGYTASMDFPLVNPVQGSYGGGAFDAFVATLSANGGSLVFATYLGGGGDDRGYGVAPLGAWPAGFWRAGIIRDDVVHPATLRFDAGRPVRWFRSGHFLRAVVLLAGVAIRPDHAMPCGRYTQCRRSFRRAGDRRRHKPRLRDTEQCLRRPSDRAGVFGERDGRAAGWPGTPHRMAEWTATASCINAELLGWAHEIEFRHYSGREWGSDQHLRE